MRLALYQPDIPQNTGTILRLAACLGLTVEIIRPAGFDISDKALRRAIMDYGDGLEVRRHDNWAAFRATLLSGPPAPSSAPRVVALSTRAHVPYTAFSYQPADVLLLGRESAGLPDSVHAEVDARVRIPMAAGRRSLNVAVAAAMVVGEALRQTDGFPH